MQLRDSARESGLGNLLNFLFCKIRKPTKIAKTYLANFANTQSSCFEISAAAALPRLPAAVEQLPGANTHISSHTQRRGSDTAVPSSVLCRRAFATVSGLRHSPRHRGGGNASRREGCGNVSRDARRVYCLCAPLIGLCAQVGPDAEETPKACQSRLRPQPGCPRASCASCPKQPQTR